MRPPGVAGDAPLTRVETLRLPGDRAAVRRGAALHALDLARSWLQAELADRPPVA